MDRAISAQLLARPAANIDLATSPKKNGFPVGAQVDSLCDVRGRLRAGCKLDVTSDLRPVEPRKGQPKRALRSDLAQGTPERALGRYSCIAIGCDYEQVRVDDLSCQKAQKVQ